MSIQNYKKQVLLLLTVLPLVGKQTCFAMHGGTAINLFHSNMPRLSVDIDLTYIPVQERDVSLNEIYKALVNCKQHIETSLPDTHVILKKEEAKLYVSNREAGIKVEVNLIKRGCFNAPFDRILCENAQEQFGVFSENLVVDDAHLFGGKICAALDRQHPRDLFDIHYMYKLPDLPIEIIKGFYFYLISSNRPIKEMLFPQLKDQRTAFENQFIGMTNEAFSYDDYLNTRLKLIENIQNLITENDKQFLLSIEQGLPRWDIYNFAGFPAVEWKLQNVNQLKKQNPKKHHAICADLELYLNKL